jgi:hypothetical protein
VVLRNAGWVEDILGFMVGWKRLCYLESWGRNKRAQEEEGSLGCAWTTDPVIVTHPHISSSSTTRESIRQVPCPNSPLPLSEGREGRPFPNPQSLRPPSTRNPTGGRTNTYWGGTNWWLQTASLLLQGTDLHILSLFLACPESSLQSAWVWHFTGRWSCGKTTWTSSTEEKAGREFPDVL